MNGRVFANVIAAVAAMCLLQGCTAALWEDGNCRPALNPNLKLYQVGDKVLVQYDEAREEHDDIQHRAYFLNENTNAIAVDREPIFVNTAQFGLGDPIPLFVLQKPTNSAALPVFATSHYNDGNPFFLVRDGKTSGPFELPVYRDKSKHKSARRAMLTPLPVTADAAALGAVGALTMWEQEEKDRQERREREQQFQVVESPKRRR